MKISTASLKTWAILVATLIGAMNLAPSTAQADIIGYNVGIDTSNLGAGDYKFYFSMNDGDGIENNSVTFKDFTASGGTSFIGSAGDFTLDDNFSNNTNESIAFNPSGGPGGLLNFNFTSNATTAPDSFFFQIYNSSAPGQPNVTTTDPFNDTLFEFRFNGTGYTAYDFAVGPSPTVSVVATPEPATWAMMGMGVCAMLAIGAIRKRKMAEADLV